MSDTDLNKTPPNATFVSVRHKRKREDNLDDFKNEMMSEMKSLLSSLMKQQSIEIKKIRSVLSEIQSTNNKIENSVDYLTAQNEMLNKKIEQLEIQHKKDKEYIILLENKVEDMQTINRKANFEIKNVPKKSGETKEDLIEMVVNLGKNIGCVIEKNHLDDIYRLGNKKGENRGSIIVETTSTIKKTEFITKCKNFNRAHKSKLCLRHVGHHANEDSPIFVSEQLTAKGARLHFLARDLIKAKKFKYCWTAYGKIYIRKDDNTQIITIKSESQIHQLSQDA